MSFNRKELDKSLSRLMDRELNHIEFHALEELLVQSPEARAHYFEYMQLHHTLDTRHRRPVQSLPGASVISMDEVIKRERRRQFKTATGIAAAVVLLLALVLGLRSIQDKPATLAFQSAPGSLFTLTHDGPGNAPVGYVLEKGSRLQISQGTVELRFASGVKSIIEAPADMTLHADDTLFMRQGTAWFEVPKEAIGFTVKTSSMEVVDLGTEFGVTTHKDKQDEIHVFTGKVKATALRGLKQEIILSAGHARTMQPGGRFVTKAVDSDQFRRSLPSNLPYLHWSFDEVVDGSFPADGNLAGVKNSAAKPKSVSPASLRTGGKFGGAVSFTAKAGQELITGHPGFDPKTPLTICYWVKLKPGNHHTPLMGWAMPDVPGEPASKYSRWEFHTISGPGKPGSAHHRVSCAGWAQGSTNIADGKWHHIATIFTGTILENERPEVIFYIDGKPDAVAHSRHDEVYSFTDYSGLYASQPIVFGSGTIGAGAQNRNVGTAKLDEIFIIQGALSQKQVTKLMETNQIQSP